ncbi:N-acetylglucosamine-6-phosphate deacetylase [Alteromonas sediminis]|uniref:N-acetylgalactosamine-6-phosphate deacetylase n=1 Tax=Alteromonas sediminis TaxID=2259342 RepID=A0A3N5XYE2_9ALTE|nr:N-acetylglucosamine-6-phosphate deacetylase [Alteromonas sediminis]RPJ66002.1 N-acetylglucosamine-6-phosphate deacetylase [Alteromonas sediminis]
MKIRVERALTPAGWQSDQVITVENGKIGSMLAYRSEMGPIPQRQGSLVPGFFDIQVNGGGGALFNHTPTLASLKTMAEAHRQFGTTAMLPTLITDQADVMSNAADAIAEAISEQYAPVVGVHFEGPYLSKPKKGVHSADFIRPPTDAELDIIMRKDLGKVLITLAPETVSPDIIRELTQAGVKVCLGHSNADSDTAFAAIEAGADGFTHLFNAMSPMTSREPGMVGVALATAHTYAGIILDGHHVDATVCQVALKCKGVDRLILVTDAMAHIGQELDTLPFFDTEIIRVGDKLTTPDGTLAGSNLDMLSAVKFAVQKLNCTLQDAILMAAETPAAYMGLGEEFGQLAVNKRADMLLLDEQLNIQTCWSCGVEC